MFPRFYVYSPFLVCSYFLVVSCECGRLGLDCYTVSSSSSDDGSSSGDLHLHGTHAQGKAGLRGAAQQRSKREQDPTPDRATGLHSAEGGENARKGEQQKWLRNRRLQPKRKRSRGSPFEESRQASLGAAFTLVSRRGRDIIVPEHADDRLLIRWRCDASRQTLNPPCYCFGIFAFCVLCFSCYLSFVILSFFFSFPSTTPSFPVLPFFSDFMDFAHFTTAPFLLSPPSCSFASH